MPILISICGAGAIGLYLVKLYLGLYKDQSIRSTVALLIALGAPLVALFAYLFTGPISAGHPENFEYLWQLTIASFISGLLIGVIAFGTKRS